MNAWKTNLLTIWFCQVLTIAGFAFGFPFIPFYLRELGIEDEKALKWWVAVFHMATPLTLAFASPLWGLLADRFGRKMMMLRATIAAGIVLTCMGLVRDPAWLIILRMIQGLFTGTVTAAQTLVAANTPEDRSGFALGFLASSIFVGITLGNAAGGIMAELYGYRVPFYAAGFAMTASSLLIVFGVKERFVKRDKLTRKADRTGKMFRLVAPALCLAAMLGFVRQFDLPFFPLLVEEIHGGGEGVNLWVGGIFAVGGVAGFLANLLVGWLSDRYPTGRIGFVVCGIAAAALILHPAVTELAWLVPLRFVAIGCAGSLDVIFQSWLARRTPPESRGRAFGWLGSARAIGWMLYPLAAAGVATQLGIRTVFVVEAALYLALGTTIWLVMQRSAAPPEQAPSSATGGTA